MAVTDVTVERAVAVVMGVRFDTTVTVFSDDSFQ